MRVAQKVEGIAGDYKYGTKYHRFFQDPPAVANSSGRIMQARNKTFVGTARLTRIYYHVLNYYSTKAILLISRFYQ